MIEIPEQEPPEPPRSPYFHARLFVLVFTAIMIVGTLVLMLPWVTESGDRTPVIDAIFTSMSALAVTGLVTVNTSAHWNFAGEAIILLLIQIGGLGFMVGASLILRLIGGRSLRNYLLIQDNMPTLSLRDAVVLTGKIARFTFIVEAIGAVLLTLRYMQDNPLHQAIWHGIFHSISAFCNAGFDLHGGFTSEAGYNESIWISLVLIGLIQAGGLSYMALADLFDKRRWQALNVNTKLVLVINLALIVAGTAVYLGAEWNGALQSMDASLRPLQAVFQSVSARTAGFVTVDFGDTSTFTNFFWIALMFVGGASGSTAGGVKLATVGIVLLAVWSEIHGQLEPQAYNRRIPVRLVMRAITVITLFFLFHFVMTLSLAGVEHLYGEQPSFVAVMVETMSAQSTSGLSMGITSDLSLPGKVLVMITMFVGRLGPLTIVYALQQREQTRRYRFPEAVVHIG